jgi:FAD/FMN-containing dehydrogenase
VSNNAIPAERFLEDASGYRGEADQAFAPATLGELRDIVARAVASNTPITIVGAGTGLTGAAVPHGGWVVSLNRFRKLEIGNGRARCGVGISLQELQDEAAKTGQFFGPNPTEYSASLGGVISTNAGGARSFCFGSVRHHILGLEVTFMDGQTRWLERGQPVEFHLPAIPQPATTKNSAGYFTGPGVDWVNLLSGSEGTLGIITEAELKLLPIAPAILSGVVFFSSDEHALDAVDAWRSLSRLRLIEYVDNASLDLLLRPINASIPASAKAAVLIEQDLTSEDDEEVDNWLDRLEQHHALADESWFGFAAQDRERFHAFRHALATTVLERTRHNGFPKLGTDFAVPIERFREFLRFYRERCEATVPGKYVIYGHIGDANLHLNILADSAEEAQAGKALMLEFARKAVSLGGTVAAEHGIGKSKRDLLRLMYSESEIEAMKSIKRRLDPEWLLGQGVIF